MTFFKSYRRTACLLCGGGGLELALPMAATPIGDAYVAAERKDEPQPLYSLDLYLCGDCGHVQLGDVVDLDYVFQQSFVPPGSGGMVDYYQRHADEVLARLAPAPGSLIVEISSNDGTLLKFYKERGFSVLGVDPLRGCRTVRGRHPADQILGSTDVDPARQIADWARDDGIETVVRHFNAETAESIRAERGPAALVEANSVFAHTDDMVGLAQGAAKLLAPDGVFVFEVGYLLDLVDHKLFDTIYHEHPSYLSVAPLDRFFRAHGLELFDLERMGAKGGFLRGYVQLAGGPRPRAAVVDELIALERERGLHRLETYRRHAAELQETKARLHEALAEIRARGGAVAGFGAGVTVTTLTHHFGLGEFLEYLVDDNPAKHGLFSPGLHLPVVSSQTWYERKPAATVILAWRYAEPIMKKHARYTAEGGRFVVPLPTVRIVDS